MNTQDAYKRSPHGPLHDIFLGLKLPSSLLAIVLSVCFFFLSVSNCSISIYLARLNVLFYCWPFDHLISLETDWPKPGDNLYRRKANSEIVFSVHINPCHLGTIWMGYSCISPYTLEEFHPFKHTGVHLGLLAFPQTFLPTTPHSSIWGWSWTHAFSGSLGYLSGHSWLFSSWVDRWQLWRSLPTAASSLYFHSYRPGQSTHLRPWSHAFSNHTEIGYVSKCSQHF